MAKKSTPKLLVFFDTNVLYTQVASDLLRSEIQKIIDENSKHPDLTIEWYLPDMVLRERKYQMLSRAKELLPNLYKIERLLGHSFGVGDDTLELHVDNAINRSLKKHNIKISACDTKRVNWDDIISRSANRTAPFEAGDKEKGFRDAIIAQSFLQLLESSPTTPNICRLAIVSDDNKLKEYLVNQTSTAKNVRILSTPDELEGLINTIVSTIPEDFAIELTQKAETIFFDNENKKSLYYKEDIENKIKEQYRNELQNKIKERSYRNDGTWWISPPIFIKKDRLRIDWASTIQIEFETYHYEDETPSTIDPSSRKTGLDYMSSARQIAEQQGIRLLGGNQSFKKVVDLKGKDRFEIHWSTSLSQAKNLTNPKLEKIVYLGDDLSEQ
jgi:hypothetical protein